MAIFTENYCKDSLGESIIIGKIKVPIEESINEVKINNPKIFSRLDSLPNYENLVIKVWPNDDGNIPHFHVERSNAKTDAAIMIMTNQYFSHGKHSDELNKDAVKILNKWLKQVQNGITPWDMIKQAWNNSNQRNGIVPDDCCQPDYSKIRSYK